jgi:hypothetical protein
MWYAMDGGKVTGPLRRWSRERTMEEMAIRQRDALNFFDEMLEIRGCAMEIYDEAMEPREVESRDTRNGGASRMERNLPVALSALKERRSVAETMAKVGLIAARLGSEGGETKKLSPELSSLLEDLKILSCTQLKAEDDAEDSSGDDL